MTVKERLLFEIDNAVQDQPFVIYKTAIRDLVEQMPDGGGGTITEPFVINTQPNNVAFPFRILAGDATTSGLDVQFDPAAPEVRLKGLNGYGTLILIDDFSGFRSDISSGGLGVHGGNIFRQDGDGANAIQLRAGGIFLAVHAAPADIDINDGDAVFWFDQSDGAAKLMVKAKTADGTVVNGSLALAE